jgi:uncharacterized protein
MADRFPPGVADKLKYYVYRLIDPRNGETFYVGKGTGERVFQHARGALPPAGESDSSEPQSTKVRRINAIIGSGFQVAHIIHRHGMDEKTAYEVEGAVIDAYPGLANLVSGHDADDRGVTHANEIVNRYAAKPLVPQHRLILISVRASLIEGRNLYDATRLAWRINETNAKTAEYVLAHNNGLVIGVFKPHKWLPATRHYFPDHVPEATSNRWGFIGEEAPDEIKRLYENRQITEDIRKKGAQNPIQYVDAV